jgi:hypothetical protein
MDGDCIVRPGTIGVKKCSAQERCPNAALVAVWLVDPEPSSDAPPVSKERLAEIWACLKRERQ